MRTSRTVLVGLLLLTICLFLFVYRLPCLKRADARVYDFLSTFSGVSARSDSVCIVEIDAASLATLGPWPWPRHRVAKLTVALMTAGASVVAYDEVFAGPDRTSPARLEADLTALAGGRVRVLGVPETLRDYDGVFAEALAGGKTVLGCLMHPVAHSVPRASVRGGPYRACAYTTGFGSRTCLPQAGGVTLALQALHEAAQGTGFVNLAPDPDEVVRSTPLLFAYGPDRLYASLALEAVRLHLDASQAVIEYDRRTAAGIRGVRLREYWIPTERDGRVLLNRRSAGFDTVSALRVLDGHFDRSLVSNRVALVGVTASALPCVAAPLPEASSTAVHATVVENILSSAAFSRPRWMPRAELALILVLCGVLAVLIHRARLRLSLLVTGLAVGVLAVVSVALMKYAQLVFVPVQSVFSVLFVYSVLAGWKYCAQTCACRRIRAVFGNRTSEPVLRSLIRDAAWAVTRNRKVEATVCCSDLAEFGVLAERLAPTRLAMLLDCYFGSMRELVTGHGGFVDRYLGIGAGLVSAWGVPLPDEEHAVRACVAALAQRARLAELGPDLKAEFGCDLRMRMALNTGTVSAGPMGTERGAQYTVLGGVVEQAAQCVALSSDYDTGILVGHGTFLAVRNAMELRLLDIVELPAQREPVRVYELLAKKGELPIEKLELIVLYQEGLRLYRERRWSEALRNLSDALRLDPGDGPSRALRERVSRARGAGA